MNILFATLFFSLLLVATFIYMFVTQHGKKDGKGFEQQALLPLQDDQNPEQITSSRVNHPVER